MNIAGEPPVLLFLLGAALFLGLTGLVVWKHSLRPFGAGTLISYALISALWFGIQWARQMGYLATIQPRVQQASQIYGAVLVCWAYLGFSLQFLRYSRRMLQVWLAGLIPLVGLIILDSNPFINFPDALWRNGGNELLRVNFCWYALLALGSAYLLCAGVATIRAHIATNQPMHRNRTRYLYAAWLLVAAAAALIFAGLPLPGFSLHLLTVPLLVIITLVHQLPDLRVAVRQLLSYAIMTVLTVLLFTGVFVGVSRYSEDHPAFNPVLTSALIAVILAVLFNPLLTLIRKLVNRMLHGQDYNLAEVVREYSQSTSNILDLELLAAVSTGAIKTVLGLDQAHLLVVEQVTGGEKRGYHLNHIPTAGQTRLESSMLSLTSPLAAFFLQEHRPLTQYDIDFLPPFRLTPKAELAWFSGSAMEVYVPILAHNDWIGLLMVGRKTSGDGYSDADILLLTALANQTASSLENAHLVQHLVALNNEVQKAYNDLNHANKKLEKLDRTKSDFIQVASHELRTPITLLMGYSDILSSEPAILDNMFLSQTVNGIRTGASRMQEIVASMLDMAKIDNSSLRLAPKALSISAVIRSVQATLAQTMHDRMIHFEMVEMSSIPLIEADVDALHKVFQHLLTNAVKFTPNGGKICVMQHPVLAAQSPLEVDSVEVVVSDNGIGIEPELQELIFSKFYQTGDVNLHSTSKSKFKGSGSGLGLAIVRGIVEAHNGKVWVVSAGYDEAKCPGSEFHVVLPLSQAAAVEQATQAGAQH
jgi:signal transduction histidine kinase